jgi:hypothetical protein
MSVEGSTGLKVIQVSLECVDCSAKKPLPYNYTVIPSGSTQSELESLGKRVALDPHFRRTFQGPDARIIDQLLEYRH